MTPQLKKKQQQREHLITNVGSVEGFPDCSSGRYSAIALVTTRARRYSATPLLSTAWSLCSNLLMTDSGLKKEKNGTVQSVFVNHLICEIKIKDKPCVK